MLLCDSLTNLRISDDLSLQNGVGIGRRPDLEELPAVIRNCQARYVIDDHLLRQCVFAVTDQMDCIRAALQRDLRLSHSSMWLEWCEPMSGLWSGHDDVSGDKRRAGILIRADDETFRSGSLKSFWIGDDGYPSQSIVTFLFDFDRQLSDGAAPFDVDPFTLHAEDLKQFLKHSEFRVDRDYAAVLRDGTPDPIAYFQKVKDLYAHSLTDLLLFSAFQLMLNMPRALDISASERGALNRARARRGLSLLLEYYDTTLNLTPATADSHYASDIGDRRGPRMHWVRGHFVRRQERVFWRRSHIRGDQNDGALGPRTTYVKGGDKLPVLK